MKRYLMWLGLALALGDFDASAETLNLQVEPVQRMVLTGAEREVVVKIDLRSDETRECKRLPLNLAVVLDRSGSMAGAKLEKAKQAAIQLIDQLTPQDTLAMVTFDTRVQVLFPGQTLKDREWLKTRVMQIVPGGSTALYGGVETGAEQLETYLRNERINRVILLSDGLANVGPSSTPELKQLGQRLSRRGISVSTIGVGDDYNEDLMAGLAEASDANYYYVQDAEKLPEIFAKELGGMIAVTARDVRIEIECPEGIEPIGLIGRSEKFTAKKAMIELGPFASRQSRYLFLRCRVDANEPIAQRDLASVTVTYRDEINSSREATVSGKARIGITADQREVADSVNQAVAAETELQLNALAKDQALSDADSGKYQEAADSLRSHAAKLEAAAPVAPPALRKTLEDQAKEQRQRADEIGTSGISRTLRKTIQNETYKQKNAKE